MVTEKIKRLEATKAKIAALEVSIAAELHEELAALPSSYGYPTLAAFIKAVRAAASAPAPKNGRKAKAKTKAKANAKPAKKGKKPRRKRAVITDETRAEVKKLVEAGQTAIQIANAVNVSIPTVHNIKRALGLVKARS